MIRPVIFLALIIGSISPLFAADDKKSELVIHSIEVEGLTRLDRDELIGIIGLGTGGGLDGKNLREGIKRAFKKGIFLDIQAVSESDAEGIKLRYIVKEMPVIKKIRISGDMYFSARKIKKLIPLSKGDFFREEDLGRVRSMLQNFYQRKGFQDTVIGITFTTDIKSAETDITINIKKGEPLVLEQISAPDEIKGILKLSAGDIFDRDILDNELKRIRDYYKSKNYINPKIGPYEYKKGKLWIPFDPGQKLQLFFKGNTVISTVKLKDEVVFAEDEEISDETIEESVDRIRKLYLSKGYYYAQIASGIESKGNTVNISFYIFEGKRVMLGKIKFEGTGISEEALIKIMSIREGKPYSEALLGNSRESLERFYNALGYLEMEIKDTEKVVSKDGRYIDITFIISEGIQTKIEKINFVGNRDISESLIRNSLKIRRGSPYNLIDISDARFVIKALYGRYGYLDARVEVESVIDKDKVSVIFKIDENLPSIVGKIILRGNNKTEPKIILREISLREGDLYNQEEFQRIKQRLYKLGIFNEVSIAMFASGDRVDGKLVKDVLLSVKEGKAGSVEFGLGYGDFEGFRGSFDISYDNVGGYNITVGFKAELSEIKKKYVFNFREPWLFNRMELPLNVFLLKERKKAINLDTKKVNYKIDRTSVIADIEKEITKKWKAHLSYEYSFVETTDVDPGVILNRKDTGTTSIGGISTSIYYDSRDDPFNPTIGFLHGLVVKFASSAFLSEVEFIKGSYQSALFFPLRKGLVLAISIKGGASYSFDNTKELPLVERFFLGGRTTVRGFENDTLGPKGADNSPTGGNIFVLGNSEFRIALGRGLGLVTFFDTGNVWKVAADVDYKLRYTAGVGLRYKTPVGPVRIDYGHKIDREPDESPGEVHFSFGHAF